MKGYDFGGQVFAGIHLGRLGIKAGFQPGMAALFDNYKVYNNTWYLNLAFRLADPEMERHQRK